MVNGKFPLEQFVTPAEIARARRMEARGLGSADLYLVDLLWIRVTRLQDAGGDPMTSHGKAAGRRLVELRRSSAAGAHEDRRTRRNRDRSSQKRHAVEEQS